MTEHTTHLRSDLPEQTKKKEPETRKTEVVIDQRLWALILEKVKKSQEMGEEFFLYLLGRNGVATMGVTVGNSYATGVSFTTSEVVQKLAPHIAKGYKIFADLHNHPDTGIYASLGFNFEAVTTASASDFDSQAYTEVPQQLSQEEYPRVIIAYDGEDDRFVVNAYYQNRDLTPKEIEEWTIEDPHFVAEEPDELGVILLADRCMNPDKLIENNVVTLLDVHAVLDDKIEVISNCLKS